MRRVPRKMIHPSSPVLGHCPPGHDRRNHQGLEGVKHLGSRCRVVLDSIRSGNRHPLRRSGRANTNRHERECFSKETPTEPRQARRGWRDLQQPGMSYFRPSRSAPSAPVHHAFPTRSCLSSSYSREHGLQYWK